jgi:hypothetical protein
VETGRLGAGEVFRPGWKGGWVGGVDGRRRLPERTTGTPLAMASIATRFVPPSHRFGNRPTSAHSRSAVAIAC